MRSITAATLFILVAVGCGGEELDDATMGKVQQAVIPPGALPVTCPTLPFPCTRLELGFTGGTAKRYWSDNHCLLDISACTSTCGDGVKSPTEACDGTAFGDDVTCQGLGFSGGTLKCTSACQLDTSSCTVCGDGVVNGFEKCEGANLAGQTCVSLGYAGGVLSCTSACQLNKSGCYKCGDRKKNGGDQCDGSDMGGATCQSLGFGGGSLACTSSCTFELAGCYKCGDGKLSTGEICDGADLGGKTCTSVGYAAGILKCAGCSLNLSGCYTCGDGKRTGSEACDGSDLGGQTCASLGFAGGSLACAPSCGFDTSGCSWVSTVAAQGAFVADIAVDSTGSSYITGSGSVAHKVSAAG
jgi:hypothetical protein